ncbi:hypothetical protein [Pseudomonas plecoglossicida]|uniref:hypothetical protein n=1 Tax=Pseudomonas plecoglossicida TaxID=70775 RepID=UPI003D1F9E15
MTTLKRFLYSYAFAITALASGDSMAVTEASLVDGSVYVRSSFGTNRFLVRKVDLSAMGRGNEVVNLAGARIVSSLGNYPFSSGYLISAEADDIAPLKIAGSYIGANHGEYFACQSSVENGLVNANDIGSLWFDSEGTGFRIKDFDSGVVSYVAHIEPGEGQWDMKLAPVGNLSEALGSRIIPTSSQTIKQVYPAVRRVSLSVTTDSAAVLGKEFQVVPRVLIVDTYEILRPSLGGAAVGLVKVSYSMIGNKTVIQLTVKPYTDIESFALVGAQAAPLNHQGSRLMQKVVGGDKYSAWTDITGSSYPVRVITSTAQSHQKVSWSNYKYGQTIGITSLSINNADMPFSGVIDISAAKKQYPFAVAGISLKANDVLRVNAYRYYWAGDEPPANP